jgi:hypothetical protein
MGSHFSPKGNDLLKRPITYTFENDEGKDETETEFHWFHIFPEDVLEWEAKYKGDLKSALEQMTKKNETEEILEFFRNFVLQAYGVRGDGGRKFDQSDEVKAEFRKTLAYQQLFTELATNADKAAEFINAVMPKGVESDQPQPKPAVVDVPSRQVAT